MEGANEGVLYYKHSNYHFKQVFNIVLNMIYA